MHFALQRGWVSKVLGSKGIGGPKGLGVQRGYGVGMRVCVYGPIEEVFDYGPFVRGVG